jgi:hypothetical protein
MEEPIPDKSIINFDDIVKYHDEFRKNNIKICVPSLEIEKIVPVVDLESLKMTILELSDLLPHRRLAVTVDEVNGTYTIEIHPVTGAA